MRLLLFGKELELNSEELNSALYNKMNQEQAIYMDWLESLPPNEILQHAYEFAVRQDILFLPHSSEPLHMPPLARRAMPGAILSGSLYRLFPLP